MKNLRWVVLAVIATVIVNGSSSDALACWLCKQSPNAWGFCRTGYDRGHGDCAEVVIDPFSGRTGCDINAWGSCGAGLGDGGGGECEDVCGPEYPQYYAALPATWTDRPAVNLV
jgi:hypothetical protein